MKKIFLWVLVMALILSSVAVPTAYAATERTKIVISECDDLSEWSIIGGTVYQLVNESNKTCGSAAAIHRGINFGAHRLGTLTLKTPVDISGNTTVEWDMQFFTQTANGAPGTFWEQIVNAYGTAGNNELYLKLVSEAGGYRIYRLSKINYSVSTVNPAWIHLSVTVDDYNSENTTAGPFDATVLKQFYFSTIDGGGLKTNVDSGFCRFDNIYAYRTTVTEDPVPEEPEVPEADELVINECNSADGWLYYASAGVRVPNLAKGYDNTDRGAISEDTGYGALRRLEYTPNSALDLSKYTYITWKMFFMKSGDTTVDMWSAIKAAYGDSMKLELTDKNGASYAFAVADMEASGLGFNWYDFSVKLSDVSGIDLSAVEKIAFYTTLGAANTGVFNTVYKIDSIMAIYEAPPAQTNWTVSGEKEWTGSGMFSYSVKNFHIDASHYTKDDLYLLLDLYIENQDGTNSVDGFSTEGQIELTSSGKEDANEINWDVTRLSLHSGINHLRLPLLSSNATKLPIDLSDINFFRIYTRVAAEKTFKIKVSNISITSEKLVTALPSYFSDNMMFQQNKPMNVWGVVDDVNSVITVELYKGNTLVDSKAVNPDSNGEWLAALDARKGGYDVYSLTVKKDSEVLQTVNNILIGELWLSSGQSNMEYFYGNTVPNFKFDDYFKLNKNVRIFDAGSVQVNVATAILPSTPANDIENAIWKVADNSQTIKYNSAIAYLMSNKLQNELDVPVGFIETAKGASVIEAWLPREVIDANDTIKSTLESKGLYKNEKQLAVEKNWQYMTTLYNTKIAPFTKANIAGMIWYQGESNIKYANTDGTNVYYTEALKALAETYSRLFRFEEGTMPFVCGHIAPYNYDNVRPNDYTTILPMFENAMADAGNALAGKVKMYQVPIYDVSLIYRDPPSINFDPIHPSTKEPVANRFADILLKEVYGRKSGFGAPEYTGMTVNGNKIIVTFKNVGDGLTVLNDGTELKGFAICDSSRVFVNAKARIIANNKVEVWSNGVKDPVAVTYAWDSFNTTASLGNSINVPAVPFRTDDTASTYILSNSWLDCDSSETWVMYSTLQARVPAGKEKNTAGFEPTWKSDAELSFANNAMTVNYSTNETAFSPITDHPVNKFTLAGVKALFVDIKNNDNRAKSIKLTVKQGNAVYTVDGVKAIASGSGFTRYIFDFTKLYQSNGSAVSSSLANNIISVASGLEFVVSDTAAGSITVDNIGLATCAAAEIREDAPAVNGDVNGDGIVDAADLVSLRKHILGMSTTVYEEYADMNHDGVLDILDIIKLKKYLLNVK